MISLAAGIHGDNITVTHKNKSFIRSRKHPSAYNESVYKDARNVVTKSLRKAEKDHFSSLIETNKHNIKGTWNILKTIINKNKTKCTQTNFKLSNGLETSDKSIISEKFNDYFMNVGPTP